MVLTSQCYIMARSIAQFQIILMIRQKFLPQTQVKIIRIRVLERIVQLQNLLLGLETHHHLQLLKVGHCKEKVLRTKRKIQMTLELQRSLKLQILLLVIKKYISESDQMYLLNLEEIMCKSNLMITEASSVLREALFRPILVSKMEETKISQYVWI